MHLVSDDLNWQFAQLTLPRRTLIFVFEAIHGGRSEAEDQGDICIDDLRVVEGNCRA